MSVILINIKLIRQFTRDRAAYRGGAVYRRHVELLFITRCLRNQLQTTECVNYIGN